MLGLLEAIAPGGVAGNVGNAMALLMAMAIGHVLGDFPLQGNFLALGKNPSHWGEATGAEKHTWIYCLTAHSLIQAGFVWAITGSVVFGLAEFVLHWVIDWAKARNVFGLFIDQVLHLVCKIAYIALIWAGVGM